MTRKFGAIEFGVQRSAPGHALAPEAIGFGPIDARCHFEEGQNFLASVGPKWPTTIAIRVPIYVGCRAPPRPTGGEHFRVPPFAGTSDFRRE